MLRKFLKLLCTFVIPSCWPTVMSILLVLLQPHPFQPQHGQGSRPKHSLLLKVVPEFMLVRTAHWTPLLCLWESWHEWSVFTLKVRQGTASMSTATSMVGLEVVTLWTSLSSPRSSCLTVKHQFSAVWWLILLSTVNCCLVCMMHMFCSVCQLIKRLLHQIHLCVKKMDILWNGQTYERIASLVNQTNIWCAFGWTNRLAGIFK